MDTNPEEVQDIVAGWGVHPDEGDHELRIVGVKLLVDGGFEGALLREPYAEPWGKGGTFRGVQTMPTENYHAIVKTLSTLGWRVSTHAVGDAAIDLVLDGYEAAHAEQSIVGRRWTIEHGFLPAEDQVSRIKKLGLFVSAQHHLYVAGPSLATYWGAERASWTTPMRFYLDQGVPTAGGTDSPVTPYAPMNVIYHFVTRDTISGGVFGADQRITREEALRVMTLNNAFLTFEENVKGSIEPGKLADLVVLSDDIMTCADGNIRSVEVEMTMVGGQVVYERK
jgi:predicted amidohydrolase YtcJ